ncbi:XRE family transcriptional regulator [Corynebacterium riegelii]|uniref:XRE family transcriptional regulator n=1 Tax=Corynebacterium riegelii TaxID=156976 RepID=UPI00288C2356|nr:XRE family transcriptional regulator [Corynebacterium riegelii]
MSNYLLSLDEIDRVKRLHHIASNTGLEQKTGVTRKTWSTAINTRQPTMKILDALAQLGADPSRVLVRAEETAAA